MRYALKRALQKLKRKKKSVLVVLFLTTTSIILVYVKKRAIVMILAKIYTNLRGFSVKRALKMANPHLKYLDLKKPTILTKESYYHIILRYAIYLVAVGTGIFTPYCFVRYLADPSFMTEVPWFLATY